MGEVKYSAAYDAHQNIVLIGEAIPHQPYTCTGCRQPMVARLRGQDRAPHFSHKVKHECSSETALHQATKDLLYRTLAEHQVNNTPYIAQYACPYCLQQHSVDLTKRFNAVVMERRWGSIIPDITLVNQHNQPAIAIEVVVTHAPDELAQEYYRTHEIPVLCVLPSWETLPQFERSLTAASALITPKHCPKFSRCIDRYRELLTLVHRIPASTGIGERCSDCHVRLIQLEMHITIDLCDACGEFTDIVSISCPMPSGFQQLSWQVTVAMQDGWAYLLKKYWNIHLETDPVPSQQTERFINHCCRCHARQRPCWQDQIHYSKITVDHRYLQHCPECGKWEIGNG